MLVGKLPRGLELTSDMVLSSKRVEAFGDLVHFNRVALPMSDKNRLDQAVHVRALGRKCVDRAGGRAQIFP